jgi:hypothetical protein
MNRLTRGRLRFKAEIWILNQIMRKSELPAILTSAHPEMVDFGSERGLSVF